MFIQFGNQQKIADQLKAMLLKAMLQKPNTPSDRINQETAYDLLIMFERAAWHPGVFEEAFSPKDYPSGVPSGLAFSDGKLNEGKVIQDIDITIFEAVIHLLARYLLLIEQLMEPSHQDGDFMGTKEAAAYLGVTERTVEKHIYETKRLSGKLIGKTLVFTREELDTFKASLKPVGRPRRVETTEEPS